MSRQSSSLVGFLNESEAIQYFQRSCINQDNSPSVLAQHWRTARARIQPLPITPGQPDMREIPAEYLPYLERVAYFPGFADVVRGFSATWKLVEIDPLISFQFHVLDDVCDSEIPAGAPQPLSLQTLLEICLPIGIRDVPYRFTTKRDALVLSSRDLSLSIHGSVQSHPGDHQGMSGFSWGGQFNQVQVIRHDGRCYLRNGYHRAVALRRKGITHMPCVLLEATDFTQIYNGEPNMFSGEYLLSAHPPTVAHLAGPMAYPVSLREYMKVITISVEEAMVSIDI